MQVRLHARPTMTGAVVVMGVSGCGKTTLGSALAEALVWRFVDGDTLHPPDNIAKMAAGIPLQDADRGHSWNALHRRSLSKSRPVLWWLAPRCVAVTGTDSCAQRRGVFVVPVLAREVLLARLAQRRDHFMPPSLLDSQLGLLELPQADEQAVVVDGSCPTRVQVFQATCCAAGAEQTTECVGGTIESSH